jgi:acetylornithine deacetylase/succinyl-diaminopimelate desuccinylase-like protein
MDVVRYINEISVQPEFQERVIKFLEQICAVDTSPDQEISSLRANEHRVFNIITSELKDLCIPESSIVRKYISPEICGHPSYSQPYYARSTNQKVYEERYNLLFMANPTSEPSGLGTALNAHIDTVAPYLPPSREGGILSGRGSADDKGNVAVIVGTLLILDKFLRRWKTSLHNRVTAMFVVDEEIGGNGSLDLAIDRQVNERYDSIMILECTGNDVHPAGRGAIFIKCEGEAGSVSKKQDVEIALEEAFAFAVIALLEEGETLRRESSHPLFPHRPVQTCTGILGHFGKHPSAICGQVDISLQPSGDDMPTREIIEKTIVEGIKKYVSIYGDKTKIVDPQTGLRKLEKHYEIVQREKSFIVKIFGTTGHMGSLRENDAAIAKWAYVTREFVDGRLNQKCPLIVKLSTQESKSRENLIFEGAQGFLPSHSIEDVKARSESAFRRGIESYLKKIEAHQKNILCEITFDKLHNDAFAGNPDTRSVRNAVRIATEYGLRKRNQPVVGWDVSCDARLFAKERPELSVITFGAGKLKDAHSNTEQVLLSEIFAAIRVCSLFVLVETGTIDFTS